ncbi:MAG: guanine deaminase [Clostridiales bacterium]|jgi:guanine deaminase|nr:guanine deaminase [Clostridiales bacterium]
MIKLEEFVLRGNIFYSKDLEQITCVPNGYLVCEGGKVEGVYDILPVKFSHIPLYDYGDNLIIPGLVDTHTHAPQYSFRGLGMDLELIEWLNQNTFPEEAKYNESDYAKKSYTIFAEDLKKSATTRACIFGTIHVDATNILMELLELSGVKCMVGKVNMDRNSPDYLCEKSANQSIEDTRDWLIGVRGKFRNITPILTPRFLPSCTDSLMEGLSAIQREFNLPVQSHLSESLSEIEWVKELFPDSSSYGAAYDNFELFGKEVNTVMAHCVYSTEDEIKLLKKNRVMVAHCPESNSNLASGIAPIRTFLEQEIKVGLGTDIAAGSSLSIFKAMVEAIKVSKLRWCFVDHKQKPLTVDEAFYLGTKGGGSFFGRVGSFEEGYEFDAVVLDDSRILHSDSLTLKERLERVIYLSDESYIVDKYIAGKKC